MSKRALLLLAAVTVVAVAVGAVIYATDDDPGQEVASHHEGMVEIAVGSEPNGISFSPLALGLAEAETIELDLGEMAEMGHGE